MPTVREIAEEIVAREGGYVNDPDDPGGATNHGVTIHTMRRLGLDLDGDGRVTTADVRRLTRAQAAEIFLRDYFERPGIARLPVALQAGVFDMQVNAGSNAVKILQRLLTRLGWPLADDGVIGPKTVTVAHAAASALPKLADSYGVARRDYYYALGDARPASRKYCRRRDGGKGGWIIRAEAFLPAPLHLSEAQHRARVAKWG
ncbi:MAG: N-acetylmuramidase [Gemmobacter sp.]|jgi:lysozyme family protein|nr:N-acetylmuramidase [Gemmobacter sp.]